MTPQGHVVDSRLRCLGLTRAPGIAGSPDVVSGMLAVSWADVERGVAVYEARKQAA
jgi:hypothetical protein